MTENRLSIGEVATRAGVNVETLRYYERRGLLKEPPRHLSGHRQYPPDAVDFIRSIKQAQTLGFTLDEIEELVAVAERRPARSGEALAAGAQRKLAEIDQKMAALRDMRSGLEAIVEQRCDSLVRCTCGKGCPVGPAPERRVATQAPVASLGPAPSRRRWWLTVVPVAVVACLACFLPAVLAGGLALGSVSLFSAVDAPADLSLPTLGVLAGVSGTVGFSAFQRRRRGGVC